MVNFEIVDQSAVTKPQAHARSHGAEFEAWCMDIAAKECARFGRPLPVVNFKRRNVHREKRWVDASQAEYDDTNPHDRTIFKGQYWVRKANVMPQASSGLTYREHFVKVSGDVKRDLSLALHGAHIMMRVGRDPEHARLVWLHELAHWLEPDYAGHGVEFFRLAFQLYERYGIDMERAIADEKRYKKRAATKAAKRYEGGTPH